MTPGLLTVGTDGSCLRNPNGPTGWAYVCDDGRYGSGGRAAGTNQVGELMAILTVLRDFPDHPLRIESDSAYAIGCSSTWKLGWQRAGYARKAGPIANLDIIREVHALLDARDAEVRFVKVKAHLADESVHPLNVRADELAGRAARAAADSRGDFSEHGNWLPGVGPVPGAAPATTVVSSVGGSMPAAERRSDPVPAMAAPGTGAVLTAVEPADGMLF
jgi:ribonuclease HI